MSSNPPPPAFNNWVKCSEGLVECGQAAAKIVKHVMEEWHTNEIKPKPDDFKCAGSPTCNPKLKNGTPNKPKAGRGYCDQCIKWADVVISQLLAKCTVPNKPPYEAYWNLVKSSDFYDHVIQVVKLFGLKAISDDALAAIKQFDDFDPAWLLCIMEKVVLFHKEDIQSQVQKATEIRNTIMHRPVGKELPTDQMETFFKSYSVLLKCFSSNFASILSDEDAKDIQAKLNQIRDMKIVTSDMVQRTVTMFMTEVENWKMEQGADLQMIQESLQAAIGICKSVPQLHDQMVNMEKVQVELAGRVGRIENEMESMKGQYSSLASQQDPKHQQSKDSGYSASFSPSSSSYSNSTSYDTTPEQKPSNIQTESKQYELLMVHSEHDMEDRLYNDLIDNLDKNNVSYVSMHELPMGVDVFKNFENMLENCWWTMCLLSPNFLTDVWCDKRYIQACERAVRKQDESVFYVKAKGFSDDDIPAGLKGISGLDHSSKFFKSVLRSTFKNLREKRTERMSSQESAASADPHHRTPPSDHLQNGYEDRPSTVVQGSNNLVINAAQHSTINIYQTSPSALGGESDSNSSSSQMGQQKSSVSKPTECSSYPSSTPDSSLGAPVECTESTVKENSTVDPGDSESNIADPSSHQEPPYKDLVSIDNASNKEKDDAPDSLGKSLPNKISHLQLLKVQDDSIDSSSSLKKSLSSPDLLSVEKDDNKDKPKHDDDYEALATPRERLCSTSESAFPFFGYSESFKPVYSKDESTQGTTGLKNIGNTCYMNSAIQCLSSATILAQYFIGGEYEGTRANNDGHVAEEFAKVMYALWLGKYKSISPADLRNAICDRLSMFSGYQDKYRQHDVQEFLGSLIEDGLHKDINIAGQKPKNSADHPTLTDEDRCKLSDDDLSSMEWNHHMQSNRSIIVRLFQGQLRSVVKCDGCHHKSTTFEVFTFLTLPIPSDKTDVQLKDCFEEYSKDEKLEGTNAYKCDKCEKTCSATKRIDIWRLPKILLICLKRFTHRVIGGAVFTDKNRTMVKFPLIDIDVTNVTSTHKPRNQYNLFAVANHSGAINYGHYTAYCQNACNKKWYEYDDDIVQEISTAIIQSPKAYVLFYSCVDLTPPV
ncbi:uncharacterized protein [Amphiura filiformis]|uniref:uncharacterized protein n=1 Tax=Amphiura filiformis TaxID=82378 RepID=UPI003B213916